MNKNFLIIIFLMIILNSCSIMIEQVENTTFDFFEYKFDNFNFSRYEELNKLYNDLQFFSSCDKIKIILKWCSDNIKYDADLWENCKSATPEMTLSVMKADCKGRAILFTALCYSMLKLKVGFVAFHLKNKNGHLVNYYNNIIYQVGDSFIGNLDSYLKDNEKYKEMHTKFYTFEEKNYFSKIINNKINLQIND
jgi:hypothetical protein